MSNDGDHTQSGGIAEDTTPEDHLNPKWLLDLLDFLVDAEDPNDDQAQQDENTGPPVQPSVEGVENSQAQQVQDNAESTKLFNLENVQDQQAQNPVGNVDSGETFPIPSVIDVNQDPSHGPYELESDQKEHILTSITPFEDLVDRDREMRCQIQQGQDSPNNCHPGKTRPIPSIMGMDRGASDGPYDRG